VVEEKRTSRKKTRTTKKVTVPAGKTYDAPSTGEETWHYDCGPDQFVYILTFADSRLTAIRTGGRGTPRGLPCPMSSPWSQRKELAR
jgi:Protein of unknown function (DUF2845)